MINGQETYVADACAQVASTSYAWTQVIAPGANTAGIYLQCIAMISSGADAKWRAHTVTPTSDADGIGLGIVSGATGVFGPRIDRMGLIIPAGMGVYVSSNGASSIFYQIL